MKPGLFTFIYLFLLSAGSSAQSIEVLDGGLSAPVYGKTGSNSFQLVYKISKRLSKNSSGQFRKQLVPDLSNSTFRLIRFDTLLNIQDTVLIRLPGDFQALSLAEVGQHTYCLFDSRNGLQLYAVDRETRSQQVFSLGIKIKKSARNRLEFQSIARPDGLYVMLATNKRNWELTRLNWSGEKVWSRNISRTDLPFRLSVIPLSSTLLNLQIEKHLRSRLLKASVLDATTGNEIATTDFLHQKETRAYDNHFFTQDSCLLITGRSFPGSNVSESLTGKPFILKYRPDGRSEELDFNLAPLAFTKFMWEDLVYDPNGKPYLIGETFTSGTLGGYIAKCVAAFPLLLLESFVTSSRGYSMTGSMIDFTKIRFQDVVYLPLTTDTPRFLGLHPSTFRMRGFIHTYPLAHYAIAFSKSRYLLSNRSGVFFQDFHQIRKLELPNHRFMITNEIIPRSSIFVSKNYFIEVNHSFYKNSYSFNIKKNE